MRPRRGEHFRQLFAEVGDNFREIKCRRELEAGVLELIAELRLNKTLFMFTTLKAGQVRLASQAQPAQPSPAQPSQLPSFLVYIFCGSWRENGEKNFIGKLIVPLILVHLLCIQRVGRVGNQSCQRDFAKFHNARRRLLPSY